MDDIDLWMKKFDTEMAEKAKHIERVEKSVRDLRVTAASPDNSVRVTLGPNGNMERLELTPRACELGPAKLADLIMSLQHQAQRDVSNRIRGAYNELGEDITGAMEMIMDYLPERMRPDYQEDAEEAGPVSPLWQGAPDDEPDEVSARRQARKKTGGQKPARGPRKPEDDEVFEDRPW